MTRELGIVGTAFAVALALVPRSADAQAIYPCVSSIGSIAIVAANAPCPPSAGGPTWTKTILNTVQAGADFQCLVPQNFSSPINFNPGIGNVTFGSAISTAPAPPFVGFLLQPGIYQIHFSGSFNIDVVPVTPVVQAILNNGIAPAAAVATWIPLNGPQPLNFVGDRLISVSGTNSVLNMVPNNTYSVLPGSFCEMVITKVQ